MCVLADTWFGGWIWGGGDFVLNTCCEFIDRVIVTPDPDHVCAG